MSKIWGPKLWNILHCVSYGYSEKNSINEKKKFIHFYISVCNIIPCHICEKFYRRFLHSNNLNYYFVNNMRLVNFINLMHNTVNYKLKKPIKFNYVEHKLNITYVIEFLTLIKQINVYNKTCNFNNFIENFVYVIPDKTIRNRVVLYKSNLKYNIDYYNNIYDYLLKLLNATV